jgi:LytS/YehU family sensor histidine kinase
LPFSILPPFYLTWWFILLEVLALAGLIYLIWRWRLQVKARKEENRDLSLRTRMFALEQQSLNSSMNRHFIFNALNSIQYYINREDKRAANKYLSSFAKLIRKNLDSTSSTWVSLKDELERLDLYLGLEHMRFRDRFDYNIEVQNGLNAGSVQIPAMMLQPFLENSIWHGILPKEERGHLLVSVKEESGLVHITIKDDGIGVEKSLEVKRASVNGHTSRGVEITNDRIQLYKKMTSAQFEIKGPVQIEEDGQVKGTVVEIYIPLMPLSELKEMSDKKFEIPLL